MLGAENPLRHFLAWDDARSQTVDCGEPHPLLCERERERERKWQGEIIGSTRSLQYIVRAIWTHTVCVFLLNGACQRMHLFIVICDDNSNYQELRNQVHPKNASREPCTRICAHGLDKVWTWGAIHRAGTGAWQDPTPQCVVRRVVFDASWYGTAGAPFRFSGSQSEQLNTPNPENEFSAN